MKWEKLGQIFEFDKSEFKHRYVSHAQSPQTLIFKDFVRVYFSTRKQTGNGKFFSDIQYVDFDPAFNSIINISEKTVIEPGKLGCFDEHGIFPINILKHNNEIYAYTCGWSRRASVSIDMSIGLAKSKNNGETFERVGNGPVLTASLNEPFLVGDGFVKVFDGVFHMWYIFGTKWKYYKKNAEPDRTYVIGHAASKDGINWEKDNKAIIETKLEGESQALPTVTKIKDKYHMYFCYRLSNDFRKNTNNSYKLGYAFSNDIINWKRDDTKAGITVSDNGWDSEMMCYPHLFEFNNEVYLLYNGNEFGKNGFGLARLINED